MAIEIPAKAWKKFCMIGGALALGGICVLMADIGSEVTQWLCLGFLILFGCLGMAAALLERLGILRFIYSADDRKGIWFKLAQQCAASEKQTWGTLFSSKYYENYLDRPQINDEEE